MEMLVVALIALAAFAAVLVPLFRRRTDGSDAHEFDAAPLTSRPESGEGVVPPMAAGPATPVAPGGATSPDAPAEPTVPDAQQAAATPDLEQEVARYRTALRAGTLCRKCGEANPPESRFCADCGAALALMDAQEFE